MPYTTFFLGIMLLVTGITELHEKRKAIAITFFFATGLSFFVSFYTLLS